MFDYHRHFTQSDPIDNALYNTVALSQWKKLSKHLSLGLLAYNIKEDINYYLDIIENRLKDNPLLQIGEIGLDNRFNNLDIQKELFIKALQLGYKYNRVLSIHIVNCNNLLLDILKANKQTLPKAIIYHGFNKSVELATILKNFNVIVSINPKIEKTKLFKNIKELDKIGFLVESDWDKETDIGYNEYFSSFYTLLKEEGAIKFEDVNNEFRTIFENI